MIVPVNKLEQVNAILDFVMMVLVQQVLALVLLVLQTAKNVVKMVQVNAILINVILDSI